MMPDIVAYLDDFKTSNKKVKDLIFDIVFDCTFPDQVVFYLTIERLAAELKRIINRNFDMVLLMDEDGEDVYKAVGKELCDEENIITSFVRRTRNADWSVSGVESSKPSKPLKEQINEIVEKIEEIDKDEFNIALIDDVIFSGTTLKYFIEEIRKNTYKKINFYGIALTTPSEEYSFLEKVFVGFKVPGRMFDDNTGKCDILCLKDFIWKEEAIGAQSYINNEKWMKEYYFSKAEEAKKKFLEIKELTKDIFSK